MNQLARILAREKAFQAERWELPDMGPPREPEPAEPAPPRPTVSDLEALEREARAEGFATGLAEGRKAALQELEEQRARLEGILLGAARPLAGMDEATEQELARLALVIARRVIGHELTVTPELILRTVREAVLALPSASRQLRVYLHPDDLALLRALEATEQHWQLLADPSQQRGDCRLESDSSRLDARVETRLAAVVDAVFGDELTAVDEDPEAEMA